MHLKSAASFFKVAFFLGLCLLGLYHPAAQAQEHHADRSFIGCPGAIHIHSKFSSGDLTLAGLADEARKKGLRYLVVTDHDLVVMEYGLFPFRNVLSKREELPSIIQAGPKVYLDAIDKVNRSQQDVVIIPGAQSSAYYYWAGSPLKKDLTAYEYRSEMLLVGYSDPAFFKNLPVLHNDLSYRLLLHHLPEILFPAVALLLSLFLVCQSPKRWLNWITLVLSVLFVLNSRPLSASRFTAYDGYQGTAPFQDLIDYANKNNVLTIWPHPESAFSNEGEKYGPIYLKNEKYVRHMSASQGWTAFSSMYGDEATAHIPGGIWDKMLRQYCRGERAKPVWTIAEDDFHGPDQGVPLDNFITVTWVTQMSQKDILDALSSGRMYGAHQTDGKGLRLDSFTVQTSEGQTAWPGESAVTTGDPIVNAEIRMSDNGSVPVKARIIRDGEVWAEFEGSTPLKISHPDASGDISKTYYRLDVMIQSTITLISNPIFVEKKKSET